MTQILGSDKVGAFRAATLGDISTRGIGQILRQLEDRPLSTMMGGVDGDDRKKSVFVMRFPGDVQASQVKELREETTAVLRTAKPGDEALLVLESGGGTVTGYGLAAGQLLRFKEAGIKLTICVEQVRISSLLRSIL
jgi:ClpP class serine protease